LTTNHLLVISGPMRFLTGILIASILGLAPATAGSAPQPAQEAENEPVRSFWLDVPFFPQKANGCGASALAMVMRYWKDLPSGDPEVIYRLLYSEEHKGIPASRLEEYLNQNGFRSFAFRGDPLEIKRHLLKGRPLIVALKERTLHYVVVVGLDEPEKIVLLNDPARKKLVKMDEREFLEAWKSTNYWTLLAVPDGTL